VPISLSEETGVPSIAYVLILAINYILKCNPRAAVPVIHLVVSGIVYH